jgi:hypothetical protein
MRRDGRKRRILVPFRSASRLSIAILYKYGYPTDVGTPRQLGLLPRAAAAAFERAARVAPVVVLLGARQTGKTTLVRSAAPLARRPYLTLDDFDLRTQAEADPEAVHERATCSSRSSARWTATIRANPAGSCSSARRTC